MTHCEIEGCGQEQVLPFILHVTLQVCVADVMFQLGIYFFQCIYSMTMVLKGHILFERSSCYWKIQLVP